MTTTAYASAVIYELAMPYSTAREAQKPLDSPELKAAKEKVGRWFANRMLAKGEFAARNFGEAKRLIQTEKLTQALELLEFARATYPFDPEMSLASGDIWLKAGRPATARWEYTIAATYKTDLAAAYVGRSEAAAMMGDARTARADLKSAKQYGGSLPSGLAERVDKLLGENHVDAKPVDLLAELDREALAGKSVEALASLASRLQRSAAEQRVRYDELYQETIRGYEDSIRADDSAIAPRVELAQYLNDEADLRGEQVEPRRGLKPFRYQYSPAMELSRAMHSVDQALKLDPKNVPAMVTKAYVLGSLHRDGEAEDLIDRAAKIAGPDDAKAMRLLALYRKRQVSRMLTAAGALRSPRFESTTDYEHRSDGGWRTTRTTRYDPTAADLARADQLERQARALIQETRQLMQDAIKGSRGTLDGLLLEASYEDWFGTREQARKLLELAVKDNPQSLKAHEALIEYQHKLGQHDAAIRQEAVSWQLFQTTCAPLLQLTWKHIKDNGWPGLLKEAEQARQLDPADARATAYFALARREIRENKESIALLKVATAIEQARLDLDEQGIGRRWPRPAGDLANAMQLHQDLAEALKANGDKETASRHFVASGDLALRFPPTAWPRLCTAAHAARRSSAPMCRRPARSTATLPSRAYFGPPGVTVGRSKRRARRYLETAARNTRAHNSMTPMVSNGKATTTSGALRGASATASSSWPRTTSLGTLQGAFERLQTASQAKPTNARSGSSMS